MCQKAFGSYFAPLAGVPLADFAWTKGRPGVFRGSEAVERGFCPHCGTPLFFRYTDKDRISLSLGSLDDPSRVVPAKQFGIESRLPFVATITSLPGTRTEDDVPPQDHRRLKSRQHPDRNSFPTPRDVGTGSLSAAASPISPAASSSPESYAGSTPGRPPPASGTRLQPHCTGHSSAIACRPRPEPAAGKQRTGAPDGRAP